MNKIIVENNKIKSSDLIKIDNNNIIFLSSSVYEIEYIDSDNISINFIVDNKEVKLYESSFDNDIIINNSYIISNGGKLEVNKFYNNKNVYENIKIDLLNSDSSIDYKFANICKGIEKYMIDINHKCESTKSNIVNKSICLKNSDIDFIINSNVLKDCKKSILNQDTRIVTIDECNAKISPNMFIDLDDVEARHGSVIGTFKEEWLFYLMSKGICYNDALKLLIKGYLLNSLVVNYDKRKKIIDIIDTYWR